MGIARLHPAGISGVMRGGGAVTLQGEVARTKREGCGETPFPCGREEAVEDSGGAKSGQEHQRQMGGENAPGSFVGNE